MIRHSRLSALICVSLCAALALAEPARAQGPADAARAAAAQLAAAQERLSAAGSAPDRVAALTETVRAFEEGLGAMRDGLREAALREARIRADLDAREREVAQLLGALQTMSRHAGPEQLLHPDGPIGAARAGMLVSSVTPGLAGRALALRRTLEEVETLRVLQEQAASTLREGLAGVQAARTDLSQAVANRTDLPRRFTEDPVKTALLIASTETLAGFADGLTEIVGREMGRPLPTIAERKGTLELPVAGTILRRAGEADAAGVRRPGLVLATREAALVTTPVPATIRYNGPLLDYGLVSILEPQPDVLFVLAGLDTVFGQTGQVLPAGAPVGLMGVRGSAGDTPPLQSETGGGVARPETLYIEVREGSEPVDPLTWFATDRG